MVTKFVYRHLLNQGWGRHRARRPHLKNNLAKEEGKLIYRQPKLAN